MKNKKLTSVHIDKDIYEEFKMNSIKYSINFNELVNNSLHLFNKSEAFRSLIKNK